MNQNTNHDLPMIYENGVLRPEGPLNFPERTRVLATVRTVPETREPAAEFVRKLRELRARAGLSTGGWRFDRDRLYDRD
jgi:predicted DNA-binding antitoxin AbrB/MazE fold protein